jgi:hypothetical protein
MRDDTKETIYCVLLLAAAVLATLLKKPPFDRFP